MNDEHVSKNWTIMVYISADDVLANFAIDSLNQFRRAVSDDGDIVMALFDPNNGSGEAFRYRFEGKNKDVPLSEIGEKIETLNMADPKTLTSFVKWASEPLKEPKDRNYCLILWGHGTELLLDRDPSIKGRRYLTPGKLKSALAGTKFNENNRLDIVALDACSMSMIELASVLQDCVSFMIASQDDVPDVSFPYERILKELYGHGTDPEIVCRLIPKIYVESFRDYLVTSRNGVGEIMLSSLNLQKIEAITGPVSRLAGHMLSSVADKAFGNAIVDARKISRDFVLGLFVDLYDFCDNLPKSLDDNGCGDKEYSGDLKDACKQVREAIANEEYVIANETRPNVHDCHGVSIYFPYSFEEDENQQIKRLLGENQTGILNLPSLVKGGPGNARKARNGRIEELEADFAQLPFFKDDGWGAFIKQGWSRALARRFPDKLDLHYSAEQVVQNLLAAPGGWGGGSDKASVEIRQLQKQNEYLTKELERLALKRGA